MTEHLKAIKEDKSVYEGHEFFDMNQNDILDEDEAQIISKHKTLVKAFPTHSKVFIDRKKEDSDVEKFQKTGDMQLLEQIYKNRIPTIRTWAAKHYYPGLTNSIEDLFEELSVVFVKAAQKYNSKRGAFNTCLFTFFDNRIKNIKSGLHAKKRISETYSGPLNGMTLSLDYAYDDQDGSEMTLKDIIPSNDNVDDNYSFKEMVDVLSGGNVILKDFLNKVGNGESISCLLKESKIKQGNIELNDKEMSVLSGKRNKLAAKKVLLNHIQGKFNLLDYSVDGAVLSYKIEVSKTKESDAISKAIRMFRKNKISIISKIKGA